MEIKITLFVTILLYAIVISQSFFYLLAMSRATRNMQALTYIESRQLLDKSLQHTLSTVYYLSIASTIALLSFCVVNRGGLLFICSIIALASLVIDVVLSLWGNVPLNRVINSWTASDFPANWKEYQSKWLGIYRVRQTANIAGFVALLAGLIFGIN